MKFSSFFKKNKIAGSDAPWKDYPSIFKHIKNNLDSSGKLTAKGDKLPDDSRKFKDGQLRWVSGGKDGVFSFHGGENRKKVDKIAALTHKIAISGTLEDKIELYKILAEDNLLDYIDQTLEKIAAFKVPIEPFLHKWASFLAFESPDRGCVKFGIALLGLIGDSKDTNRIFILGKHEEFTLFAAVALSRTTGNVEIYLWKLAQYVHGWGKIHLVDRLAGTENPDIRLWMLLEGYKNSIMYEYLAYTCAVTGNLKEALSAENPGDDLLNGAGEIIRALIIGGPAENLDCYTDAARVISLYLAHTLKKRCDLPYFLILDTIRDYLTDEDADWNKLKTNGWSLELKNNLLEQVEKELSDNKWKNLVEEKRNTDDNSEFYQVNQAADILGINMWDIHLQRLYSKPGDQGRWFNIMKNANSERIDKIVTLALDNIQLEKIATGARDNLGLGEQYAPHDCLNIVVQELSHFPGKGSKLIQAALKSPVTGNRNIALRTLDMWGTGFINGPLKNALIDANEVEPNGDTKKKINKLLKSRL